MPQLGNKHYSYNSKGKKQFVSDKIKMLMHEGKPRKQSIAIALSIARKNKA